MNFFATLAWIAVGLVDEVDNTSGVPIPDRPEFSTEDPVAHGEQVAAHADLYDRGWIDEVTRGRMTLYDAGGDSVERTFSRLVLEDSTVGDKIIVRFLTPAEIKGVAALTHERAGDSDDNWLYLPANKSVRRISGANKTASFQGTEFTYEDLSNLEVAEYDWRYLDESTIEREGGSVPVLRVEASPNYKDTGYSRIVVHYHTETFRRERIDYYDKAERLLKTLDSAEWQAHHGRFWRANLLDMVNHQTGKRTVLRQERSYVNLSKYPDPRSGEPRANLDDSRFTTQALQL